jgi:hypothetical protein
MHLFDADDILQKYNNVPEIIDAYYETRLEMYGTRKEYLIDALEANPEAFFSYGLLSVKHRESYVDIMNFYAWDTNLFSDIGNYIDALTLLDREKVLNIGGFSDSLNLYGWEDFDLWARIADIGGYGAQTKNFVAT